MSKSILKYLSPDRIIKAIPEGIMALGGLVRDVINLVTFNKFEYIVDIIVMFLAYGVAGVVTGLLLIPYTIFMFAAITIGEAHYKWKHGR